MAQKKPQITLTGLSAEQLNGLKQQFEGDIQSLTTATDSIRAARNRFYSSKELLDNLKTFEPETEMMVPLTSSLYVPGKVKDTTQVIVDVGTGYYIKHTVHKAQAFFDKRAGQMVTLEANLQQTIHQKQQQFDQVIEVLQQKLQAMKDSGAQ